MDQSPDKNQSGDPLQMNRPVGSESRWIVLGVCVFLGAITLAVFGQTLRHEFVNFDDNIFVYENRQVSSGLTGEGIVWAFTHGHGGHWIPLTTLSHMLDCQLYGLNAGGHHLTNLLLHTASVILLFLVLRRMTAALWPSAFVAAMFAVHPLRVESVAWVTERKDVLSGLFFMLTLWAYVRHVRPPWSLPRYLAVILMFAFGLMSKLMVATLPLVLLLLDYWPLKRFEQSLPTEGGGNTRWLSIPRRLILEKVPLLVLVIAAGMGVLFATTEDSVVTRTPLLLAGYALLTPVVYLGQMFYPAGLAVYSLPPKSFPLGEIALAATLLAAISAGVFVLRRKRPYLLVGWLWYLVMLAPVLVLIQQGMEIRCDRYTYLPQIGVYLLLTWAVADLCASWNCRRLVLGSAAAALTAASILSARIQTSYWRNSESLWTHTLACTSSNALAHNSLGSAFFKQGRVEEAIAHFREALAIQPDNAKALNNLGMAFLHEDQADAAIEHFQKALQIHPDDVQIYTNLGIAFARAHYDRASTLIRMGQNDEAIVQFRKAVDVRPDFADARHGLAIALLQKGQVNEAIAQLREIFKNYTNDPMASFDLGNAYFQKGQMDEAAAFYQKALEIKPDYASARNNLGMAFLKKGMVDEAVAQFRETLTIQPDFALARTNLDKALLLNTHKQTAQ